MTPPASDQALLASMVEVVRVDGFRQTRAGNMEKITVKANDHEWTAQRASKVSGIALPTEQPHGGTIKNGFRVHGFINHTEIPLDNWRFDIAESPRVPWRPVGLSQATMAA